MASDFFDNFNTSEKRASLLDVVEKHSDFVNKLKLTLLLLALLLIMAVVVWPLFNKEQNRFQMTFDHIEQNEEEKPVMVKPRFSGVDKDNQPYNVTADEAIQEDDDHVILENVNGDVVLRDGMWLSVVSDSGRMNLKKKKIDLSGNVNMFSDNGYEFVTESAHVDFEKGMATGNEAISGKGPLGKMDSNGFIVRDKGESIMFYGKVHVRIAEEAQEQE